MFERFTHEARRVVVVGQEEARGLGHRRIGTEHLLIAMLSAGRDTAPSGGTAYRVLTAHGLTATGLREAVRVSDPDPLDGEALARIGIDLDSVVQATERTFGRGALSKRGRPPQGHIPFAPEAKKMLELALREAIALKHGEVGSGHLLLGMARDDGGTAAVILRDAGLEQARLREEVLPLLRPAA